jgi:8-oxo-dGTP diphosphatase
MSNRTNAPASTEALPWRTVPDDEGEFRVRRGVKALVTSSDCVLLVWEHHADGTPFWTLPGGGAHPGESLETALRREISEELRCRSVVGDPVASFWYAHRSLDRTASVYAVLDCSLAGTPTPDRGEVVEARWVCPSAMPARTLPQVRTVLKHATPVGLTGGGTGDG